MASPARQRISQASAARLCLLRTRRPWVKLNDIISTAAPRSRIDHVTQSATSSRTGAGDGGGSGGGGCSGGVLVGSGVIDGADCCMCCMRYWLVAAQATHYHGDCRKRPRAQAENHAPWLRACRHLQIGVQEHARLAWEVKHGRKRRSGYAVAVQGPSVSRSRRVCLQPRSVSACRPACRSCRTGVRIRVGFVHRSSSAIVVVMLPTLIALVPVVSAEFDKCARPSGVWVGYDQVSACMT